MANNTPHAYIPEIGQTCFVKFRHHKDDNIFPAVYFEEDGFDVFRNQGANYRKGMGWYKFSGASVMVVSIQQFDEKKLIQI